MAAHEGPLLGVEGAGLVEDLLGDGQLADVVQLGGLAEVRLVLDGEAHPLPDRLGQPGHGGVAFDQLGVAFLERAQQGVTGLPIR
jgi:hypothetical protein